MNLCDICKKNNSTAWFDSSRPSIFNHAMLPRIRSEIFYFCYKCSHLLGIDRNKYEKCDSYTRLLLGKYDPVPRRTRLIYRELVFHKDLDKIITEYCN